MGKATISIPLVTLRPDGLGGFRPRYIPGNRHRGLGLKGEDLRHADGRWFSLDECAAWSIARQKLIDELAAAASPRARKAIANRAAGISVAELFERWFLEPRMNGIATVEGRKERRPLAAHTVRFYRNAANQLQALDDGLVWVSPAAAVSARVLAGVIHAIEVKHGLATTRAVRAAVSAAFGWGKGKNLVPANPAAALDERLPVPAARIRYGSIAEMKQLIAAADLLQLEATRFNPHKKAAEQFRGSFVDVGDAIVLGLWSGQRQADRLALEDFKVSADGIVFNQHKKHGQPLLIPAAPELAQRLERARRRRAPWKINYPHVLLDEALRRPWSAERYRKAFAQVRKAAVDGIFRDGVQLLAPMPSLADFNDQDLRDTAVTWLALAGCTKPEIGSITGHALASIDQILKHYLGLHPDLARSAIGKLVAWHEGQQGETNGQA